MNPAGPPMAVTRPADTFVGVTFRFGFAHCGVLNTFVVVISMRSVGPAGACVNRKRLCTPRCQRFKPGPSITPRPDVPNRPIGEAANAVMSYHGNGVVGDPAGAVGSSKIGRASCRERVWKRVGGGEG